VAKIIPLDSMMKEPFTKRREILLLPDSVFLRDLNVDW